jgi:hypothetical protein
MKKPRIWPLCTELLCNRSTLYLTVFLFIGVSFLFSETTKFEDVRIRRHKSADKRELVDKYGVLAFDDDARKLTFKGEAGDNFAVPYSDITKVVFDTDTHMNAGAGSLAITGLSPLGGLLASSIHVHDHWLYLEYSQGDHSEKVLLVLPEDKSNKATAKAKSVFGERVVIASYPEKGEPIADKDGELDKRRIPDLKSKHSMKLDRTTHPLPEVKPDKATIVVVCPPLAARFAGWGNQFKLHANGKVIAVNKVGTYSIAYVDPGKYSLISQSENANGFEMDLEAGKTYYFIQETFQGNLSKYNTMLSRNSPEVVMYLVDGAYFSDWKRLN